MNARQAGQNTIPTISGKTLLLSAAGLSGEIDLHGDVAEALARLCRFAGHVPGGVYSVAQHSVLMCDAAQQETGDAHLAAICLLHDAREFVIGDTTTPAQRFLADIAASAGHDPEAIRFAFAEAGEQLDRLIFKAARIPVPSRQVLARVKDYDIRMLATERAHLLLPTRLAWGAAVESARPIKTRGRIKIWPTAKAADEFRDRLSTYCPGATRY
jgi:uncharacterized protein